MWGREREREAPFGGDGHWQRRQQTQLRDRQQPPLSDDGVGADIDDDNDDDIDDRGTVSPLSFTHTEVIDGGILSSSDGSYGSDGCGTEQEVEEIVVPAPSDEDEDEDEVEESVLRSSSEGYEQHEVAMASRTNGGGGGAGGDADLLSELAIERRAQSAHRSGVVNADTGEEETVEEIPVSGSSSDSTGDGSVGSPGVADVDAGIGASSGEETPYTPIAASDLSSDVVAGDAAAAAVADSPPSSSSSSLEVPTGPPRTPPLSAAGIGAGSAVDKSAYASAARSARAGEGPMSPFSPRRRSRRRHCAGADVDADADVNADVHVDVDEGEGESKDEDEGQDEPGEAGAGDERYSLAPCRKVSVLVRVRPPRADWDAIGTAAAATAATGRAEPAKPAKKHAGRKDGGGAMAAGDSSAATSLCLFPLLPPQAASASMIPASFDVMSPMSKTFSVASHSSTSDIAVVNPVAFGDHIPSELTMETAKLVSEVSGSDTEDWCRRYLFDRVLWPDDAYGGRAKASAAAATSSSSASSSSSTSASLQPEAVYRAKSNAILFNLAAAVADDAANRGVSSVIAALGERGSGRTYSIFGRAALPLRGKRRVPARTLDITDRDAVLDRLGLLGSLMSQLLTLRYSGGGSAAFVLTLSVLELCDDDSLRDALRGADEEQLPLKIRQPDTKGAVVTNLGEIAVECLEDIQELIVNAFKPGILRKAGSSSSRGHMIATAKIYPINGERKSGKTNIGTWDSCALIQLVDLACADPDYDLPQDGSKSQSVSSSATKPSRRPASIRKTLSGLRGILRGLIIQENCAASGNTAQSASSHQPMSFRECTLTRLLQRSLDSPQSRAVLLATVCPRRESYVRTLRTLDYINRLLVKPGSTAQTPFRAGESGSFPSRDSASRELFADGNDGNLGTEEATDERRALLARMAATSERTLLRNIVSDPRQRIASLLKVDGRPMSSGSMSNSASLQSSSTADDKRRKSAGGPGRVGNPTDRGSSKGKRGTFDNVLEKLDALEYSPGIISQAREEEGYVSYELMGDIRATNEEWGSPKEEGILASEPTPVLGPKNSSIMKEELAAESGKNYTSPDSHYSARQSPVTHEHEKAKYRQDHLDEDTRVLCEIKRKEKESTDLRTVAENEVANLRKELDRLRANSSAPLAQAREKALIDELNSLRSFLNLNASEVHSLRQKLSKLEEENEVANVQRTASDASNLELQRQLEFLQNQLRRSDSEMDSNENFALQKRVTDLLNELEVANDVAAEHEKRLADEAAKSKADAIAREEKLVGDASKLAAEAAAWERKYEDDVARLEADIADREERLANDAQNAMTRERKLDMDKGELRRRIEELQKEVEGAMHAKIIAEEELSRTRSTLSGSLSHHSSNSAETEELQSQLDKLTSDKRLADAAARERELKFESDLKKEKDIAANRVERLEANARKGRNDAVSREGNLRRQIEELALRVRVAMHQKEVAEEGLSKAMSSSESRASSVEDNLKRQVDSTLLEKEHLTADNLDLRRKLAELQDEILAVSLEKAATEESQKELFDLAAMKEGKMSARIDNLMREVEEALYAKYMVDEELLKTKTELSAGAELTNKVSEQEDSNPKQKRKADASEDELAHKQDELKEAIRGKILAETELEKRISACDDLIAKLGSANDRLSALEAQKLSDESAFEVMKKREADLLGELNALRAYSNQVLIAERNTRAQLMKKIVVLESAPATDSSSASESQRDLNSQETLEDVIVEKEGSEQNANEEESKSTSNHTQKLQYRPDEAAILRFIAEGGEEVLNELIQILKSPEGESDNATLAKLLAESKLGRVLSSSSSDSLDDQLLSLHKELYDLKLKHKIETDEATKREEKLEAEKDGLLSRLESIKQEWDKAAESEAAKNKEMIDASKESLARGLVALQSEVKRETHAKLSAESELEELRSIQTGSANDSIKAQLKEKDDAFQALKAAADVKEDEMMKKFESLKALECAAVAREKQWEVEKSNLSLRLQTIQEELDDSEYEKAVIIGDHKIAMNAALQKEADLLQRLEELKIEVESAIQAKVSAESELNAVLSELNTEAKDGNSAQHRNRYNVLMKQKREAEADKSKADAIVDDLTRKISAMQEGLEEAVYARHVAEAELNKIKTYASSTSSETEDLAIELQTAKEEAVAKKIQSEELEKRIHLLQERVSRMQVDRDDAVAAKHEADDLHAEDIKKFEATNVQLLGRIESLQKEIDSAVAAKTAAEMELRSVHTHASSEDCSSEVDGSAHSGKPQEHIIDNDLASRKELEDQLKASNKSIIRLKDELRLLKQHANVLQSGKQAAEEMVRAHSSSASGSLACDRTTRDVFFKQIELLKEEKKLCTEVAGAMRQRLISEKQDLQDRLTGMHEELSGVKSAKDAIESELIRLKKSTAGQPSPGGPTDRDNEGEYRADDFLEKIERLMMELEWTQASEHGKKGFKERAENILDDLANIAAQKTASDNQVAIEQSEKVALQKKIDMLQEQANVTMSENERTINKYGEDLAEFDGSMSNVNDRAQSLQADRYLSLNQVKMLEDAFSSGHLQGEHLIQVRRDYIGGLEQEIFRLEGSVRSLINGSKLPKEILEGQSDVSIEGAEADKFCALDLQIKFLASRADYLNQHLAAELKDADNSGEAKNEDNTKILDLQSKLDEISTHLATINSPACVRLGRIKQDREALSDDHKEADDVDTLNQLNEMRKKLDLEKSLFEDEKSRYKQTLVESFRKEFEKETALLRQKIESDLHQRYEAEKAEFRRKIEDEEAIATATIQERDVLRKSLANEKAARNAAEAALGSIEMDSLKITLEDQRKVNDNLDELRDENSRLEQLAEEAIAENESLSQENSDLIQKVMRLEQSFREAQTKNKELQHNMEATKTKAEISLAQVKKEAAAVESQLKRRITCSEQVHSERIAFHEKQLAELRKENDELSKKIVFVNEQKLLKRDVKELVDDIERTRQELASKTSELATAEEKNTLLTKELAEKSRHSKSLEASVEMLTQERQKAECTMKDQLVEIDRMKLSLEENAALQSKCEALERSLDMKDEEVARLLEKEQSGTELVSIIKEQVSELQREKAKVESSLKTQRKKYESESAAKRKLERENLALKSSIKECDFTMEQMRKEVVDLKATADSTMKRLEEKKGEVEKELRSELDKEKKKLLDLGQQLQDANDIIRELKSERKELETTRSHASPYSENVKAEPSGVSVAGDSDTLLMDLQEENSRLRGAIAEMEQRGKSGDRNDDTSFYSDAARALHLERELRQKAEEIAAALARRAKAGFEQRNIEIIELKTKLSALEAGRGGALIVPSGFDRAKETAVIQSVRRPDAPDTIEELERLRPIVAHLEYLYEMKDRSLKDIKVERDEAKREARKYKALAAKLHRQLAAIDEQLITSAREEGADLSRFIGRSSSAAPPAGGYRATAGTSELHGRVSRKSD